MQHTHGVVTPPERRDALRLSDGRRLAWSEWGPADGRPILFCPGAGMSGWLGFGAAEVAELDLRLMAIDRAGLGASDPHPAKTLSSWADDVAELIGARGLESPLAVGFSQGAVFALALAGRGLVTAAALVAGQDELGHPGIRPLLHPDVAAMLATVEADAAGFERHVAATATAEWLWGLIAGMSSETDRALYERPDFADAYRTALAEGFGQGADGYARDLVNALGPWLVRPEEVHVPVDLWYGVLDTSTVHSPDFGATLAERLPRSTRTVDPDAGGSLLWTRSRDILTRLRSHASG
ncbi:alpha/beta hydrolase [Longimicrobium sp.]|uniref:alpha/beta fold hydrolase n=1 Tax=Longimicrobium sp. TaxID=2029185 RepID=UPI002E354B78|nr:alpha/beta hydrolase [Longimicrobium sp.]HEX6041783.1 alpha/beta hydrolase [Longimicrobium sp.]